MADVIPQKFNEKLVKAGEGSLTNGGIGEKLRILSSEEIRSCYMAGMTTTVHFILGNLFRNGLKTEVIVYSQSKDFPYLKCSNSIIIINGLKNQIGREIFINTHLNVHKVIYIYIPRLIQVI